MNSERGRKLLAAVAGLAALVAIVSFVAVVVLAKSERTAPDYQGFNLDRPWFSSQSWDWFLDMVNQPSIKPQEVGTFQAFPDNSVPRTGREAFIPPSAMLDGRLQRDVQPLNPQPATPESLSEGQVLFETYCGPCHGLNGEGGTPVTQKGMPAPPIQPLLGFLSEPHLYNKALYGGPIMPAYGYQTTQAERWHMVNYMKSAKFGKGGSP